MTSRDFCYWLQGYFELTAPSSLTTRQAEIVKNHLAMVFKHEIDPGLGDLSHVDELKKIHSELDEVREKAARGLDRDTVFTC
jgi:hypothetical protein